MKTRIARRIFPAIVLLALLLAGVKTASASVPMTFQGSYDVLIPGGPKGTFEYLSVYVNYKGAMVGSDNNEGQFYSEQKMLRMTGNGKTIVGELDSCGMYYVGAIRNDSDICPCNLRCIVILIPFSNLQILSPIHTITFLQASPDYSTGNDIFRKATVQICGHNSSLYW